MFHNMPNSSSFYFVLWQLVPIFIKTQEEICRFLAIASLTRIEKCRAVGILTLCFFPFYPIWSKKKFPANDTCFGQISEIIINQSFLRSES